MVHLNRLTKKKQLITVFSSGVRQSKELKVRGYRAPRNDYAARTFEPTFPTSGWNAGVHIKEKRHLLERHSKGQFCKNTVYLERDMPCFAFVSTKAVLVRKIDTS